VTLGQVRLEFFVPKLEDFETLGMVRVTLGTRPGPLGMARVGDVRNGQDDIRNGQGR
jgi:hypothetical protein